MHELVCWLALAYTCETKSTKLTLLVGTWSSGHTWLYTNWVTLIFREPSYFFSVTSSSLTVTACCLI